MIFAQPYDPDVRLPTVHECKPCCSPKTVQENHFHDLIALAFKEDDLLRIGSQVIGHSMTAKEKSRIYRLLLQPDF